MLFPTFTFAAFFIVVLPLSWLTMPRPQRWRAFMLIASYVFYGAWKWQYVFLLAGSTLFNHVFSHAIHRQQGARARRALLGLAVAGNLGLLGYFKYYDFFLSSAGNVLGGLGVHFAPGLLSVVLPIGISFFTFMALSYVIEVHRRNLKPVTLGKFAVYLSFFPHLVAGPIVRPGELLPQFEKPRDPRQVDTSRAFALILGGLFKKVVISTVCAQLADAVFGAPDAHSSLETLVGVYAYAVQIYADFSGYTDIAIGVALLLGFRFPRNFDAPYTATSLQDFWHRWHITLSRWFRDYVYIPLGGNRRGEGRVYANVMLTMLVAGLWHGAGWTFVVWGAIHGAGQCIGRWRRARRGGEEPLRHSTLRRIGAQLLTFHIVCLAWVFFRADSFANAGDVLGRLFSAWGQASPAVTVPVVLAIVGTLAVQYVPRHLGEVLVARFSGLGLAWQGVALGAALMVVNALGPEGVAPFIYFRF